MKTLSPREFESLSGQTWITSEPVRVLVPETAAVAYFELFATNIEIVYTGGPGLGPILTFGKLDKVKMVDSSVFGLKIKAPYGGDDAICVGHADFTMFRSRSRQTWMPS